MTFCSDCFQNEGLKSFIKSKDKIGQCSSCELNNTKIANWSDILNYIKNYISKMYKGSVQENYGNFRIDDVLRNMRFQAHTEIKTKLISELKNVTYRRIQDIEDSSRSLSLPVLWSKFKDVVKHESRFFSSDQSIGKTEEYKVLFHKLDEYMRKFQESIVKTLNQHVKLYRARTVKVSSKIDINYLGPPPKNKSIFSTRLSPVGIPFFYASLNQKTALSEIKGTAKKYVVGKWTLEKPCQIIDLSRFHHQSYYDRDDHLPDYFSERSIEIRNFILFLRELSKDFSKPIEKRRKYDNIEYIPTQIITEYFKLNYRDIYGIQYKSSVSNGGYNIGLFTDKFSFQDNTEDVVLKDTLVLKLESHERVTL